jgi:hypothetical protein
VPYVVVSQYLLLPAMFAVYALYSGYGGPAMHSQGNGEYKNEVILLKTFSLKAQRKKRGHNLLEVIERKVSWFLL